MAANKAEVLTSLAPQLPPDLLHESLATIRALAARGRPAFLSDLAALMPWLAALASPRELTEIAIAIRDVTHCWP